jgi:hypothetical protein
MRECISVGGWVDCWTYHDVSIARVRRPRWHLGPFRLSSAADRRRAIAGAIVENIEVLIRRCWRHAAKKDWGRTGQEALKGCPKKLAEV